MADTGENGPPQPSGDYVTVFKKPRAKKQPKRPPSTPPPPANDSDDSEDEAGQRTKRMKKGNTTSAAVTASSSSSSSSRNNTSSGGGAAAALGISGNTVFEANRNLALDSSNDATKYVNWFNDDGGDKRQRLSVESLLCPTHAMTSSSSSSSSSNPGAGAAPVGGTYRGLASQTSYVQRNPGALGRSVGPIKAPTNVRTTTIADMAPDVCKDFKQTGYCGYGDNCRFMHSREDYQHGWQIEKEWEEANKGSKRATGGGTGEEDSDEEADEAMLEDIPFACGICRAPYKAPVVTRCGHHFCEACALRRYRRDPGCAACGAGTGGVFNAAKRLQKLLERKRERETKEKREEGRKRNVSG
ncbi:hypothetical protein B0T17DRAFT_544216 [Bombardia bombarda]|uniref:Pre-mRNA-splicing factor CWC24 n=1 Tax=Bombardia bombarda TaxID=252184 RepID=A0AA39U675_9PEZI|nr:hypothetical protein B0T17DRAFT_544216 [Bombardia bombarda]